MLDSLYAGLTGLAASSRGLANISNNVTNMNTPGFKRTQLGFQDLLYQQQGGGLASGNGVDVGASSLVFRQGELRQTGNEQDAAIDGNGLFILRRDGEVYYSRAGDFSFDAQGYLVARNSQARVAVLGSGGQLQDLNITGLLVNAPQPSASIRLNGNLSVDDAAHEIKDIRFIDASGGSGVINLAFTNNGTVTPRNWLLKVTDRAGATLAEGALQFQGDGSLAAGSGEFSFTYASAGVPAQTITLRIGGPGVYSGITNFSAGPDSTAAMQSVDGHAAGNLSSVRYDDSGMVTLAYSNGQVASTRQLALAFFSYLPDLRQEGGNLLRNEGGQAPQVGAAGSAGFGRLVGGSLESANVDLPQQFTELIVTQRAYQASSQVISAANEMIQQLLDLKGRR